MATVLFTWELGGGFGHLVRHRGLIERLLAAGHLVHFHAKLPANAAKVFAGMPVTIGTSPAMAIPVAAPILHANSYPEVIWNSGFAEVAAVQARVGYWLGVLDALQPAVVVADYSPGVVLACKLRGQRVIAAGCRFYTPARLSPMPPYRYWLPADHARLAASEAALLGVLNAAAANLGHSPFGTVTQALVAEETFLLSFEEFDHNYHTDGAEYLGSWPVPGFGEAPTWRGDGPRIFAYLDRKILMAEILAACASSRASLCLYAPGEGKLPIPIGYESRVHLADGPVNLSQAAAESDLCLSNANSNSMMPFLLAGKPHVVVPYTLEKYLIGRRLELLGAGFSAPRNRPGDLAAKLAAVLHQRDFRRAAERFARRYSGQDGASLTRRLEAMLALPGVT